MKKSLITLQVAAFVCYLTGLVFADNLISRTKVTEYIKNRINSTPGRRCTSVVLTEKSSKGYTGYVEWDNETRTALTVWVHDQKILYSFGDTIRSARATSEDNQVKKKLNKNRIQTALKDSPEHPIPDVSEKSEDVIIWVCLIGSIVLLGRIVAAIVAFVKHTMEVYDYNILNAGNVAMVGLGLSLWIVTPLLVDLELVPKQGFGLWSMWVGCGFVSLISLTLVFIRTASNVPFSKAVVAFPIQVVVGPLVILFWLFVLLFILHIIGYIFDRLSGNRDNR
jgi:hypothetical protein